MPIGVEVLCLDALSIPFSFNLLTYLPFSKESRSSTKESRRQETRRPKEGPQESRQEGWCQEAHQESRPKEGRCQEGCPSQGLITFS